MGKIKQMFRQPDNVTKLKEYSNELSRAQETFAVHQFNLLLCISNLPQVRAMGSSLSHVIQMKKDAKQQHEELVALLKAHPELTNSDGSTVRTTLLSSPSCC
jgi:hypothetical protein